MAQILQFYDKDHVYELDGVQIPSVSEISRFASREIYGDVAQYTLDNAADRGTRVHKACENLDRYGDCEADVDIAPYVKAYIDFCKDRSPQWLAIEKPFASPKFSFAGTIDRIGRLSDGKLAIVDLKTSSTVQKVLAQIQLNAYKALYEENATDKVESLYILHLQKDGAYKLIEFPIDDTLFKSCYTLHQALEKKKRGKKKEK